MAQNEKKQCLEDLIFIIQILSRILDLLQTSNTNIINGTETIVRQKHVSTLKGNTVSCAGQKQLTVKTLTIINSKIKQETVHHMASYDKGTRSEGETKTEYQN